MEETRPTTRRETRVPSIAFLDLKLDPPLSACIIEDPAASSIHEAVIDVAETHLEDESISRTEPSLAEAISFTDERGSLAEPRFKSEAFTDFHRRCQLAAGPSQSSLETGGEAAISTWQESLVDQPRPQTSSTTSGPFSTRSSTGRTHTAATTPSPDHSHVRSKTGRGKRITHQEHYRTSSGSASSNIARIKRVSTVASSPTKTRPKGKLAFFESGKWKSGKKERTGAEFGLVRSMSILGFRSRGRKTEKDEDKRVKDQKGEKALTTKMALKRSSCMIGAEKAEDNSLKKETKVDRGKRQKVDVDKDVRERGNENRPYDHLSSNATQKLQDDFREFFFFNDPDDSSESSSSSRCSTFVHPCSRGNIDNNHSRNKAWYPSSALATATIPIPPKSPRRHFTCNERNQLRSLSSPSYRTQRVSWGAPPPRQLPLRLAPAIPRWKRPLPPSPSRPQQGLQQQQRELDLSKRSEHLPSDFSHAITTKVGTANDNIEGEDGVEEGHRQYSIQDGSDGYRTGSDDEDEADEEEEGGEVVVALAQEVTFRRPVIVQHISSFCNAGGGGGGGSGTNIEASASTILDACQ